MSETKVGESNLSTDVVTYLQKVYYELEGYRSLLGTMAAVRESEVPPNSVYQSIMSEFQEKNAEFNLIMAELKEDFMSQNPAYEEIEHRITVRVNFNKELAEFTIPMKECGC